MTFFAYLRDHFACIVILGVALVFDALMLSALGVASTVIIVSVVVVLFALFIALGINWIRKRTFYRDLTAVVNNFDKSYLIAEVVEEPTFAEGRIMHEALRVAGKAMNDRIASYRQQSEDYRDFIELWIHEVKTPLSAAHVIAANTPRESTEAMVAEIISIENYVEQALFYARSTALEQDYVIRPLCLNDVVHQAVKRNSRALIAAGIALQLEGLDTTVYSDTKWLVFIIGQILANCAKYAKPSGGIVRISAGRDSERLDAFYTVLTIQDTGIGIPAADVPRVFDKGFTGANGRHHAKSTGIGLYLCRELCQQMGLTLSLTSKEGQGTCINISFPEETMHFRSKSEHD